MFGCWKDSQKFTEILLIGKVYRTAAVAKRYSRTRSGRLRRGPQRLGHSTASRPTGAPGCEEVGASVWWALWDGQVGTFHLGSSLDLCNCKAPPKSGARHKSSYDYWPTLTGPYALPLSGQDPRLQTSLISTEGRHRAPGTFGDK